MSQLTCFHCQQAVLDDRFRLTIDGQSQPMCCPGCAAAASSILAAGLGDFYQYQTAACPVDNTPDETLSKQFSLYDRQDIQQDFVWLENDIHEASFIISGISCSACTWLIEKRLSQFAQVVDVRMNLSTHRLWLQWQKDTSLSELMLAVAALGYQIKPFLANEQQKNSEKLKKQFLSRIGVAIIGMVQVMMNAVAIYIGDMEWQHEHFIRWASLILTLPVVFYSAQPFFKGAWRDIKSRRAGMDIPIALAIGSAFIASIWATVWQTGDVYYESVTMFTLFLLIGRYLEFRARLSFGDAGNELLDVIPTSAERILPDGSETVAAKELQTDDTIRIRAGSLIAADGIILHGNTQVDESSLTGEATLIDKTIGADVRAGSINVTSTIDVQVIAAGQQTQISSLTRLLERAGDFKPKAVELADKLASQFVLLTILLTLVTGIIWLFIDPDRAFWVALSVLVITCPCSLSLATPTALTAATTALRRAGLLISRNQALIALSDCQHIAFDKTGTLTQGKPSIEQFINHSELSDEQLLNIAASIETYSEHPLAKAILASNHLPLIAIDSVDILIGQGINATINKDCWLIGSAAFAEQDAGQCLQVVITKNGELMGEFSFADSVRSSARVAIQELNEQQLTCLILSGDPSHNANLVAQQLGIDTVLHNLSAQQKQQQLRDIQQQHPVIMVGDGINDSLVIAEAHVSIAMASGTDLAKHHADILLLNDQLHLIPAAIRLSKRVKSNIQQNFTWSLIYNFGAVPIAMFGVIAPWQAAIGMSLSSLLVVLNALRVGRLK